MRFLSTTARAINALAACSGAPAPAPAAGLSDMQAWTPPVVAQSIGEFSQKWRAQRQACSA